MRYLQSILYFESDLIKSGRGMRSRVVSMARISALRHTLGIGFYEALFRSPTTQLDCWFVHQDNVRRCSFKEVVKWQGKQSVQGGIPWIVMAPPHPNTSHGIRLSVTLTSPISVHNIPTPSFRIVRHYSTWPRSHVGLGLSRTWLVRVNNPPFCVLPSGELLIPGLGKTCNLCLTLGPTMLDQGERT